ncbi:MAG: hypothetical protein H6865_08640 [Rhodospirillales bacterium]|nr:hypothetical protein [Alphaproteobacteria bacterium]MCB9987683.1 hypothetical protein [Rhodospirillales bacterium]USO08017.1 MAG: hypothetical protein H6866_02025 [Rhodospirillales bacterium]
MGAETLFETYSVSGKVLTANLWNERIDTGAAYLHADAGQQKLLVCDALGQKHSVVLDAGTFTAHVGQEVTLLYMRARLTGPDGRYRCVLAFNHETRAYGVDALRLRRVARDTLRVTGGGLMFGVWLLSLALAVYESVAPGAAAGFEEDLTPLWLPLVLWMPGMAITQLRLAPRLRLAQSLIDEALHGIAGPHRASRDIDPFFAVGMA